MVFVVPVTFMHLPALLVVIVVGMVPVSAGIGRALPTASSPDIAASIVAPVAFGPDIALAGHRGTDFNPEGRWVAADVDVNLGKGGSGEGEKSHAAGEQV